MRRTAVICAALTLDWLTGDPPNAWHPVAWLGRLIGWLSGRAPTSGKMRQLGSGALIVAAASGVMTLPAWALSRWTSSAMAGPTRLPRVVGFVAEVLSLKATFALRGLLRAGEQVQQDLERRDLPDARRSLRSLVSRDTSGLTGEQVAAAAVESVAENLTDSVVAPLLAYAVFGLPGAACYRAVNTCDAMIGYHGRYEYLGKVAARLDDVLNLAPARAAGLLLAATAPLSGGSAVEALRLMLRDHGKTESPNAGWTMSAAAGALGVQLEKTDHYRLGDAVRPVIPQTIAQAGRLVTVAVAIGAGLLAVWEARHDAGAAAAR